MKKNIIFYFLLLLFINVYCQESSEDKEFYKEHTVQIKINDKHNGFGLVVGEANDNTKLFILTAYHVVKKDLVLNGNEIDAVENDIKIKFFRESVNSYKATLVEACYDKSSDIALLVVDKPVNHQFNFTRLLYDEDSEKRNKDIVFIGSSHKESIDEISTSRKVLKEYNEDFRFDNSGVEFGTSGAPIFSNIGFIGIVLETNGDKAIARSINKILEVIKVNQYPYHWKLNKKYINHSLYAGIEIGTKGVKYALIEKTNNQKYRIIKSASKDKENHTTSYIIDNKIQDINDLKQDIKDFFNDSIINKHPINRNNIYIVFSSAYRNTINKEEVFKNIKKDLNVEVIDILTVQQEGDAEFQTINKCDKIPYDTKRILNIDIGSGNTKITIEGDNQIIFSRELKYGTLTLSNLGKIKQNDIKKDFDTIRTEIQNIIKPELEKIFTNNSDLLKKDVVIFTGGAPYRVLLSLNKNKLDDFPNLENEYLEEIRKQIKEDKYKQPDGEVPANFTNKELLVGQEIIQTILDLLKDKSIYFFERKTWIPGYLVGKFSSN